MSTKLEYRKKAQYRTRYNDKKWIEIQHSEKELLERNAKGKFEYRETPKAEPTPSMKKAAKKKVKKEDLENNED